ncbi:glycoside hydrolase family 15 protein [Thermoanaerobacterium thermosaccharolyticum]|uniref:glycoside hydrolase family 15 protein n=1 Tax=Thermoanaerobacterium thermosaccharolyticum TaxID=1517 RepID=UPI003D2A862C
MIELLNKSVEIIKDNQSVYGSFIASPYFPTYHYSWLRDGSFIAYSMDLMGEYESAEKFYHWIDTVIKRYGYKVENIKEKVKDGKRLVTGDFLHARYTLDGYEETEQGWGNFQLDGYGTWLWGLSEHIKLTGKEELIYDFKESIELTIEYLSHLWNYPNYDVWEENGDKIHTSTLACIYGGIKSINEFLHDKKLLALCNEIKSFILTNCVSNGHFVKYIGSKDVDASLTWLPVPFEVIDINDEIFNNTVEKIEKELFHNGGLHRFKDDTYYGGGEWILLSAWLGWYYAKVGEIDDAKNIKKWIEDQMDDNGYLPEQVCFHVNDDKYYPYWIEKWGEVAKPLLWSHAMYIVLIKMIEAGEKNADKRCISF